MNLTLFKSWITNILVSFILLKYLPVVITSRVLHSLPIRIFTTHNYVNTEINEVHDIVNKQ